MPSITLTFSSDASDNLVIELDAEKNENRTVFSYGSKAYFKVFGDPNLTLNLDKTAGVLSDEGTGQEQLTTEVAFLTSEKATFSKPVMSIISNTWFGNSLGNISKNSLYEIECETEPSAFKSDGIGICEIDYKTYFSRYSILVEEQLDAKGHPIPSFPVIVYITGSIQG